MPANLDLSQSFRCMFSHLYVLFILCLLGRLSSGTFLFMYLQYHLPTRTLTLNFFTIVTQVRVIILAPIVNRRQLTSPEAFLSLISDGWSEVQLSYIYIKRVHFYQDGPIICVMTNENSNKILFYSITLHFHPLMAG